MSDPIITLTSDFGLRDYYVSALKGYIYSHLPTANIVDISHQIKPFHIAEAAFILRSAYKNFPRGTIHLICMDSDMQKATDFILVKYDGHFFLARDNGVISLVISGAPEEIIKLKCDDKKHLLFFARDVLAEAALTLIKEGEDKIKGEKLKHITALSNLKAILTGDVIRGTVIYVDNFGNAVTNIQPGHLERYKKMGIPIINYTRNEYIDKISTHYDDVPEGERLCLFGNTGFLEIAINKGSASQLLGLYTGHVILVEFE